MARPPRGGNLAMTDDGVQMSPNTHANHAGAKRGWPLHGGAALLPPKRLQSDFRPYFSA